MQGLRTPISNIQLNRESSDVADVIFSTSADADADMGLSTSADADADVWYLVNQMLTVAV